MASERARRGARTRRSGEECDGRTGSLINSFTPSATGWSRPWGPTMLGPLRNCMYPRVFRSRRVRNATATRIGRMYKIGFTIRLRSGAIIKERT